MHFEPPGTKRKAAEAVWCKGVHLPSREAEWCWGMDDFWIPGASAATLNTGVFGSALKKTKPKQKKRDRFGVRLKWWSESEGLMEHIELWFCGLSRFLGRIADSHFRAFFFVCVCVSSWLLIFLFIKGNTKREHRRALCEHLPLCVCLPMHDSAANINPYGDNLCGCSLHFSDLSQWVKQRRRVMC